MNEMQVLPLLLHLQRKMNELTLSLPCLACTARDEKKCLTPSHRRKKSVRNWREKDCDHAYLLYAGGWSEDLRWERTQSHDPTQLPQLLSCDKDFAANGLVLGLYQGIRFVSCNKINKSSEEVKFLLDFIRKSSVNPWRSRSVCAAVNSVVISIFGWNCNSIGMWSIAKKYKLS